MLDCNLIVVKESRFVNSAAISYRKPAVYCQLCVTGISFPPPENGIICAEDRIMKTFVIVLVILLVAVGLWFFFSLNSAKTVNSQTERLLKDLEDAVAKRNEAAQNFKNEAVAKCLEGVKNAKGMAERAVAEDAFVTAAEEALKDVDLKADAAALAFKKAQDKVVKARYNYNHIIKSFNHLFEDAYSKPFVNILKYEPKEYMGKKPGKYE